jgi:hypothetical protein
MEEGNWEPETQDKWSYKWNSDNFSTKKAYCLLQGTQPASPLFPWLWSSGNLGKHKFFFWLLLKDKLNTGNLLRRKNKALEDYNCAICNRGAEETSFHLSLNAHFVLPAGTT